MSGDEHGHTSEAWAWVDFNDVDPDGNVTTLAKFVSSPLRVGMEVTARDDDGNARPAVVTSVDRIGIVTVHLSEARS